jgi:hypothetical protein
VRPKIRRLSKIYRIHFTRYQVPATRPPSNSKMTNPAPTTASLNFRYLPSLGGESAPCGKYGGGLSVPITINPQNNHPPANGRERSYMQIGLNRIPSPEGVHQGLFGLAFDPGEGLAFDPELPSSFFFLSSSFFNCVS